MNEGFATLVGPLTYKRTVFIEVIVVENSITWWATFTGQDHKESTFIHSFLSDFDSGFDVTGYEKYLL